MLKSNDLSLLVLCVAASIERWNFHGVGWRLGRGCAKMCAMILGRLTLDDSWWIVCDDGVSVLVVSFSLILQGVFDGDLPISAGVITTDGLCVVLGICVMCGGDVCVIFLIWCDFGSIFGVR